MSQEQCDLPVMFRYTWPGNDEKFACFAHAAKAVQIAQAMGFYLEVHRLEIDEVLKNPQCSHLMLETSRPEGAPYDPC